MEPKLTVRYTVEQLAKTVRVTARVEHDGKQYEARCRLPKAVPPESAYEPLYESLARHVTTLTPSNDRSGVIVVRMS